MARKLSRRAVTEHVATQLLAGVSQKKVLQQLAAYLIESRRTNELNLIIRDIQYHLAEKGVVSGTVTSASELSAATEKAIKDYAKKATGAKEIHLDTVIQPEILGGIQLSLPGKELDTTIARKLTLLKTRYKKA